MGFSWVRTGFLLGDACVLDGLPNPRLLDPHWKDMIIFHQKRTLSQHYEFALREAGWVDGIKVSTGQWGNGIGCWSGGLVALTLLALAGSTLQRIY